MRLRTGRKLNTERGALGVTLWLQRGPDPQDEPDDELLGLIIKPDRADFLVKIANGERPSLTAHLGASPGRRLLDLSLVPSNEHGCDTVRDYLLALLAAFINGQATAKYGMTGDSSWPYHLYIPMVKAGLLPGRTEWVDDGYGLSNEEEAILDGLIADAIKELY